MPPTTQLGAAVLARRKAAGLTLRELGAELGVHPSTASRIERGLQGPGDASARLAAWLGWTEERVVRAHRPRVVVSGNGTEADRLRVADELERRAERDRRLSRAVVSGLLRAAARIRATRTAFSFEVDAHGHDHVEEGAMQ